MDGSCAAHIMSRITVIALLAINLLVLGFHLARDSAAAPPSTVTVPAAAQTRLPLIKLVSEDPTHMRANSSSLQCFTVGPFETEEAMWRVHDALYDQTLDLRQRRTEALMELGFWVSLPPFDSFAAAGQALRDLQQAGLEDMAVVNNEPGVFHLSLGYFLDERNARRRRDQVREQGFEAVTRLQRETQPRWWLDFAQSPGQADAGGLLQDLVPAGLNRGIPCAGEFVGQ